MPDPNVEAQVAQLLGDVHSEIDISQRTRVFCNRNLRMESIELIGFDMDYTLAIYNQEKLELLSVELTVEKLIANRGYPTEIRDLHYDPRWAIRGVVVDSALGNIFKMDRHRHVGRVHHGRTPLSSDDRRKLYRNTRIQLESGRYHWIDTLFGLPEAVMYVTLVDWVDQRDEGPTYQELFDDIRACIDEAHRDDSLKSRIKADLPAYIDRDPRLPEALHKLRSSGKKTFLLTNSYFQYTNAVMTYLLNGARAAYPSWRNYFDVIIVGGQKPGFFTKNRPFIALDEEGNPTEEKVGQFSRDVTYQGGNIIDFEKMTGTGGDRVLYVGDHIYGDILRLKKSHIWRTAMVVQELDRENSTSERLEQQIRDLSLLDRRRRNLQSEIDYQVTLLKRLARLIDRSDSEKLVLRLDEARTQSKASLDSLRDRARLMQEEVDALERTIDRGYNPHWGAVFREGNENSAFGEQVSDYADLYTSRVSNFAAYSPVRYFRAPRRQMPHEIKIV